MDFRGYVTCNNKSIFRTVLLPIRWISIAVFVSGCLLSVSPCALADVGSPTAREEKEEEAEANERAT